MATLFLLFLPAARNQLFSVVAHFCCPHPFPISLFLKEAVYCQEFNQPNLVLHSPFSLLHLFAPTPRKRNGVRDYFRALSTYYQSTQIKFLNAFEIFVKNSFKNFRLPLGQKGSANSNSDHRRCTIVIGRYILSTIFQ